ncbi:hypothetical protein AB6A40_003979 [Gnathostoma spinigerum]|uniref:Integrator complex subunit 1 R4 domain-containing protein n=1 Tax=Gnathostoma spinigerum TaxID=75299 RepID=A0ABD6EB46_9BILA
MSAALQAKFEITESWSERLSLFEELSLASREFPERAALFSHHLQSAFYHPLAAVRSIAYEISLSLLSANSSLSEYYTNAFIAAILHKDATISAHALSFLPRFVTACQTSASRLIEAAAKAVQKCPSPSSCKYLAFAMAALNNIELEQDQQHSPKHK